MRNEISLHRVPLGCGPQGLGALHSHGVQMQGSGRSIISCHRKGWALLL